MSDEFRDYVKDKELNIETTGRNDDYSDTHRYPYEPTSYAVLDRIIESGYLEKEDIVLDYGCGMGRVPIYLNHCLGCKTIGIELVEEFYIKACQNKINYAQGNQVSFFHGKAEQCVLSPDISACFFFNPFDLGILRGVMGNILDSYHRTPRRIRLFYYYAQDEYIGFLSGIPELIFLDEVDCMDLFPQMDSRNRVMIFETVV
ncbi:MAG: class I SAM-dependent methyltransferase [Agathobacter sp.]|nr:class I SAM-dependent methyltransferase [Agathobacter sp.]